MDELLLAQLEGPLDEDHAAGLVEVLAPLFAQPREVILDLQAVSSLDGGGARALLRLYRRLDAAGGTMVILVKPASAVERVLVLLRLDDLLPLRAEETHLLEWTPGLTAA
jgi:anti-anti-sigma factor